MALYSSVGNPRSFKNGRQFAAWLGLVPKQYSTGGKTSLGRITKRGDKTLRALLIHGARTVVQHIDKKQDYYSLWVKKLKGAKGYNLTAVALANRNARIAWALMAAGDESIFSNSHNPIVH